MNTTRGICPVCGILVDAKVYTEDGKVYLEKYCLEHGKNTALISSDYDYYKNSHMFIKNGQLQNKYFGEKSKGCPNDCGLCPDHEQHICVPVIEITGNCNLDCPICIANENKRPDMTLEEIKKIVSDLLESEGKIDVLNLSGGEPTIHPDYKSIIEYLTNVNGITKVSVSTNGIKFLDDKFLDFHREKSVIISLQLDGNSDEVYLKLRGKKLAETKKEILEKLVSTDADCSVIMTVAKGINDDVQNVRYVYETFLKNENFLSLMFHPLTYSNEYKTQYNVMDRVTIPDVIDLVSRASNTNIAKEDFMPLPCCNANCFSLVHLLRIGDGQYLPLKKFIDQERYIDIIKNKTLFGTDEHSFNQIKDLIFDLWAEDGEICDCMKDIHTKALSSIKGIIKDVQKEGFSSKNAFKKAGRKIKSVYIHHFMDADTFDLSRARRCCTIYPKTDGKFYPICTYNNLYRGKK